jgi:hypothetical protein
MIAMLRWVQSHDWFTYICIATTHHSDVGLDREWSQNIPRKWVFPVSSIAPSAIDWLLQLSVISWLWRCWRSELILKRWNVSKFGKGFLVEGSTHWEAFSLLRSTKTGMYVHGLTGIWTHNPRRAFCCGIYSWLCSACLVAGTTSSTQRTQNPATRRDLELVPSSTMWVQSASLWATFVLSYLLLPRSRVHKDVSTKILFAFLVSPSKLPRLPYVSSSLQMS